MDILKSSTSNFLTSLQFANALSSSTRMSLHGCCSFISVVLIKQMMWIGALLNAVGNNHSILVFAQTTMSMEVKPCMGDDIVKGKVHVNKFSWLKVTGVNCCAFVDSCHF